MTKNRIDIGRGVTLSYEDVGEGQPLLLIHGFTGTGVGHMSLLIDAFRADYRVLAPDLRGYGDSRPPDRDFPPDFYQRDADDLGAFLQQLGCDPVVVMGFSDGAEAALLLAATYPQLVRAVVAWGVSGVISPEELASVERWLPVSAWGADRESWRQEIIERHGEEQLEPMITGWVEAARAITAAGGNICYRQAADISCPVLLLNGDGEVGNTVRDVKALAERIPNCRLEFVAGSDHGIQYDQPETLIALIRAFLDELGPSTN